MDSQDNLNTLLIATDGWEDMPLQDYSTKGSAQTEVIFRNLEDRLIEMIHQADAIFGCVAWLTNPHILDALATKQNNVSIVIQKEDFLRPDRDARQKDWKIKLRQMYRTLGKTERYWLPGVAGRLSSGADQTCEAVRCVGNHNSEKHSAFPRMHNKFLVFCTFNTIEQEDFTDYTPYAVWTGSFNLTFNATMSFENAVIIYSSSLANAYLNEWSQILALSEPLDWESEWVEPTWRIGT